MSTESSSSLNSASGERSASEVKPLGDGGPAFPVEVDATQPNERQTGNTLFQAYGMTLRDYFAARAIHGYLAVNATDLDYAAKCAYRLADAMLRARATQPT